MTDIKFSYKQSDILFLFVVTNIQRLHINYDNKHVITSEVLSKEFNINVFS